MINLVIVRLVLTKLFKNIEIFNGLFLVLLSIAMISCHNSGRKTSDKQEFIINSNANHTKVNYSSQIKEILSQHKGAVKVVDFLPTNYNTNANIDYTTIIQDVLNKHSVIEFPNFPVLVNEVGLNIRSNSTLIFPEKSILKFASSDKISYKVLNFTQVENVTLFSPKIEGDRYRRKYPEKEDGEWGMGISIRSSKNITINNAIITHCWGDGLYIGGCNNAPHNENIIVNNLVVDNVRRNGVSITCGKHVHFNNARVINNRGKSPESGIDIEPNFPANIIEDVLLSNPFTANNANHGIVVSLGQLVGENEKKVSVKIENHIDENSNYGFTYASFRKEKLKKYRSLTGNVINNSPKYTSNKKAFLIGISSDLFPLLTISNPEIYKVEKEKSILDTDAINSFKNEKFKSELIIK